MSGPTARTKHWTRGDTQLAFASSLIAVAAWITAPLLLAAGAWRELPDVLPWVEPWLRRWLPTLVGTIAIVQVARHARSGDATTDSRTIFLPIARALIVAAGIAAAGAAAEWLHERMIRERTAAVIAAMTATLDANERPAELTDFEGVGAEPLRVWKRTVSQRRFGDWWRQEEVIWVEGAEGQAEGPWSSRTAAGSRDCSGLLERTRHGDWFRVTTLRHGDRAPHGRELAMSDPDPSTRSRDMHRRLTWICALLFAAPLTVLACCTVQFTVVVLAAAASIGLLTLVVWWAGRNFNPDCLARTPWPRRARLLGIVFIATTFIVAAWVSPIPGVGDEPRFLEFVFLLNYLCLLLPQSIAAAPPRRPKPLVPEM